MTVPARAALAAATAVVATSAAMLAGAHPDAPAGPRLAAQAAPIAAPMAAPPPPGSVRPQHQDRAMPMDPSGAPWNPSTGNGAPGSGSTGSGSPGSGSSVQPSPTGPAYSASPFASGAVSWATVNCAEVRLRYGGGTPADAGGPLVPFGATSVTRCETPLTTTGTAAVVAVPKVLVTGVDRFAAILNALPPVPADQSCLPITLPVQLSLVFTFTDQAPVPVVVDPVCSA